MDFLLIRVFYDYLFIKNISGKSKETVPKPFKAFFPPHTHLSIIHRSKSVLSMRFMKVIVSCVRIFVTYKNSFSLLLPFVPRHVLII